jgi:hypothetical protein
MWSLWAHAGISYIRERVLSRKFYVIRKPYDVFRLLTDQIYHPPGRPRGIRLPEDEDESA